DPDAVRTRAFQAVFPDTPRVVLVLQSPGLFEPASLDAVRRLEERLATIPGASPVSALSLFDPAHPGPADAPGRSQEIAAFARGSGLLRRQGLAGEDWLGLPVGIKAAGADERDAQLAAIDEAIAATVSHPGGSLLSVRRVGAPYLESWIEGATRASSRRTFPL